MSEAKHTPGPWVWHDCGGYHLLVRFVPGETFPNGEPRYEQVHSDGSAGGEYGPDIDVNGPDGRLIASAPELLADRDRLLAAAKTVLAGLNERIEQGRPHGVVPLFDGIGELHDAVAGR